MGVPQGGPNDFTSVFGYPVPAGFFSQDVTAFGFTVPVWGLGLGVLGALLVFGVFGRH